jgi:hypothetical protein
MQHNNIHDCDHLPLLTSDARLFHAARGDMHITRGDMHDIVGRGDICRQCCELIFCVGPFIVTVELTGVLRETFALSIVAVAVAVVVAVAVAVVVEVVVAVVVEVAVAVRVLLMLVYMRGVSLSSSFSIAVTELSIVASAISSCRESVDDEEVDKLTLGTGASVREGKRSDAQVTGERRDEWRCVAM